MSYNLMAEGDLDFFELAQIASRYQPLELFPIPGEPAPLVRANSAEKGVPDALGIALPSSRIGAAATATLRALIEFLWNNDAAVFDLHTGERVSDPEDLAELERRIAGY